MNNSARLLGALTAIAVSSTAALAQSTDDKKDNPKALFVQHAESATLSDGTLTLDGVNNHMIIFADRPFRAASVIPTERLIEVWNKGADSFAEDPPNAAVVGEVNGEATSLIVEITNPQLADGNLTFDYTLLEGPDSVTLDKSYVVIDESFMGDLMWTASLVDGDTADTALLPNTVDASDVTTD